MPGGGGGGVVLPMMAYTGRFRPKGLSFRKLKGPFIIIFRIDAPYGCISLFIKHYMKMRTRLSKVGM